MMLRYRIGMWLVRNEGALFGLLFLSFMVCLPFLVGCADLDYRYQYIPPKNKAVFMQAHWVGNAAEATRLCRQFGMKTWADASGCCVVIGQDSYLLISVIPRSFQDRERLAVIGEETVHAFGGQHLERP